MSTLTPKEIRFYMEEKNIKKRLIITPLLDSKKSIDPCSVDVRLGAEFIIFKKQSFPILDIAEREEKIKEIIEKSQERVIKKYGEQFILHPHQFVIGGTLEYIQLPQCLMCYVIGKSTWGRMGLIIATATKVDPGFKGCITLEIINQGEVPLILYPGIAIAQLVFHKTTGLSRYKGTYDCPTSPIFPNFANTRKEIKLWLSILQK